MTDTHEIDAPAPEWADQFLEALRAGQGVRAAILSAGVASSTVYTLRKRDPDFRRAWNACLTPGDPRKRAVAGPRRKGSAKLDRFLAKLGETSNVTAAAAFAGLALSDIYKLRREDPTFVRRWSAALAEGYDHLEMEMLDRLRTGESADTGEAASAPRRKFDTVTAFRCLTAHRESMAREKGKRTLAEEVVTIQTINAKIDALRLRETTNLRLMEEARAKAAGTALSVVAGA